MGKTSRLAAKLPKSIRIRGDVSYKIEFVKHFDDPLQLGECCKEDRLITLKAGMSNKKTGETLIHEVLHAIEFEYSIEIPHWLINALETPLYKIVKLNGWLP